MNSDKIKWNRIFAAKDRKRPSPPGFIHHYLAELDQGRVLDVACGEGAVALYLAQKGFQVTAVDISVEALKRLKSFARDHKLNITTLEINLDAPDALNNLANCDGIVISRYKPSIALWPRLANCLRPGGKLIISTFNQQHHLETGFAQRFCLQTGELKNIHPDLKAIHYQSIKRDQCNMDEYLMVKAGS